ncbi:MAG: ABC transporter permease [Pseudonocardiales bacterium]|nr:ABC transporter permease [Hyphomicrobiales bacterium]MBV8825502.1 ABC transporter permease [Hyphomicrobiales bacterium]MBV9429428.1 ABC transporter permease [Bradyrhizobiaceae bacterium]MBV9728096.1 ABC transporter permease [Pseudonocardiales bacterium]
MTEVALPRGSLPLHLLKIEVLSYLKHPLAVFWTFAYPIILFFLLNAIFGGSSARTAAGGVSYTDYLVSGLAVMTVITTALFGFAVALVELRARGRLKLFGMMPFSKSTFFLSFTASRVMILVVFCLVFVGVLSHLAPNTHPITLPNLLLLCLFLASAGLVLIGCSILVTSLIKRTSTAHAIINFINIPVIFLSDLFLPASILPKWLFAIVKWSPFFIFTEKYRAVYADTYSLADIALWTGVLALSGIVLINAASRLFTWNPSEAGY